MANSSLTKASVYTEVEALRRMCAERFRYLERETSEALSNARSAREQAEYTARYLPSQVRQRTPWTNGYGAVAPGTNMNTEAIYYVNTDYRMSAGYPMSASDTWNQQIMTPTNTFDLLTGALAPLAGAGARTATGAAAVAAAAVMEPEAPLPAMASIGHVSLELGAEDLTDDRKQLATEAERVLGFRNLRTKLKAPSPLRCVLAELGIEVLNAADVQVYKKGVKEHFRTNHDPAKKMYDPTWTATPLAKFTGQIPDFVISKAIEVKKAMPSAEFFVEHFQEDPFLIVSNWKDAGNYIGRHSALGDYAVKQPDDVLYLDVWDEKSFEAGL